MVADLKTKITDAKFSRERIPLADSLATEEDMRRVIQVLSDSIEALESRVALLEKVKQK